MKRIPKMPHRDPNIIQIIFKYVLESPALIAAITSIARYFYFMYRGKAEHPFKAAIFDAFICMLLSLCIAPVIEYFNLPAKADLGLAAFIGCLGAERIRYFLSNYLKNKIKDRPDYPYEYRERNERTEIDDDDL